jgi:hypothetical protein
MTSYLPEQNGLSKMDFGRGMRGYVAGNNLYMDTWNGPG